jgi:hypothetical protein
MDWLGDKYERLMGRRSLAVVRPSRRVLEARVRILEAKVTTLEDERQWEFNAPFDTIEECNAGICGYVTRYLAAGPADLTHEGFHAAETQAAAHYETCGATDGRYECVTCRWFEERLRA